ncbi:M56 family metallopeptidase [Lysobacter fragariae]
MSDAMTMLVPTLALALLHFLWQGALLGLFAALVLVLLRNARPQARYAVACLSLLACVLLPAWNLVQALAFADAPTLGSVPAMARDFVDSVSTVPGATLRALPTPSAEALPWVVALWAAGAASLSLRMGCGLLWVRRLCRTADDVEPVARWQACVDRLAPRLGITRAVTLRLTQIGDGPVTAGWHRPMVLLPLAVATHLPVELVEALIAHELAHIRRHDYLVNLLQGAAEALLFYHPVVWWLSHRIREERELVADDLAATALGDRRCLALALAELDRHVIDQVSRRSTAFGSVFPSHYAPAAHGGQLMSRIKQLVRPEHRALGGALVLPLIGLAIAGATFAHARLAAPTVSAAPAATTKAALPAPTAKPGMQILADADEPRRDHSAFALVRKDGDDITLSGDTGDIDDIHAARDRIDGDFVWFRRDGKSWVVRDADTIARVRNAFVGTEALNQQMQALETQMQPHNDHLEALSARMESLSKNNAFESPEARAATAKMEALGEKMEALGERQGALAERMGKASEADMARLDAERDALDREQEALNREMEQHNRTLEALNARMEAQHEPMEALSREMEAASKPMEAIGREMETLGTRIERESEAADAQVRKLLDEAYRSGLAEAVPAK